MKETYINDIKDLKELLDEASEEYLQKEKEVGEVQEAKKQMEVIFINESPNLTKFHNGFLSVEKTHDRKLSNGTGTE